MVPIAGLDRLDELICLLDEIRDEGAMRLFGIPRTAARRAQPVHHPNEVEQPRARQVVGPGQQFEVGDLLSPRRGGRDKPG
jgi:hypothetical protein